MYVDYALTTRAVIVLNLGQQQQQRVVDIVVDGVSDDAFIDGRRTGRPAPEFAVSAFSKGAVYLHWTTWAHWEPDVDSKLNIETARWNSEEDGFLLRLLLMNSAASRSGGVNSPDFLR